MKRINAFIKGAPESSLAPLPQKDSEKSAMEGAQGHRAPDLLVPCPGTCGLQSPD